MMVTLAALTAKLAPQNSKPQPHARGPHQEGQQPHQVVLARISSSAAIDLKSYSRRNQADQRERKTDPDHSEKCAATSKGGWNHSDSLWISNRACVSKSRL